jgi:hypothetical protein
MAKSGPRSGPKVSQIMVHKVVQNVAKKRSKGGQKVASDVPKGDQKVVKRWSKGDQKVVKKRSSYDQLTTSCSNKFCILFHLCFFVAQASKQRKPPGHTQNPSPLAQEKDGQLF